MSGRRDADACAIRVMLADDHRATLCGIAVVLDAPFAVDWLQRMERSGEAHGRRGDEGDGAETGARRTRVRRASSGHGDAWVALHGNAGSGAVAETHALAARTSLRVPPFVATSGGKWPDALLPSPSIAQPVSPWPAGSESASCSTPTPTPTPTPLPLRSASPAAGPCSPTSQRPFAANAIDPRPAAVWHPAEHPFRSPTRSATARRGAALSLHEMAEDSDNEAHVPHALLAAIDALDDRSAEPFARIQVRDGIALTPMGTPRNDAPLGAGRSAGATKGAGRRSAFRDDRGQENVVVTGAYSRSADLFDALSTTPCDVLVCDLAMGEGPHGDGLTMIGYLRRHYPCVKLVVHTMCLHACVLRNLQLLHVPGIVSKMDDLALVRRAVSAVHKGGTFHGPSIVGALTQAGYRECDSDRPAVWSKREAEVIRRFVNGDPVKDIAKALNRSVKTVSTQKMSAMHKAGINSNAELYQYAAANGLLLMPGVVNGEAWQWSETANPAAVSTPRPRRCTTGVADGASSPDRVNADSASLSSAIAR